MLYSSKYRFTLYIHIENELNAILNYILANLDIPQYGCTYKYLNFPDLEYFNIQTVLFEENRYVMLKTLHYESP